MSEIDSVVAQSVSEAVEDKSVPTGVIAAGANEVTGMSAALNGVREVVENQQLDEERVLYNKEGLLVRKCHFGGPIDGESALKECSDFTVEDSVFSMRYVLWHDRNFVLRNTELTEETRAPLWYDHHGLIENCKLHSIKNIRECLDITLKHCDIDSDEFGWKSSAITLEDCRLNSLYALLDSRNLVLRRVNSTGKYALQYIEDSLIEDCSIETKDCLWHARNVTVKNSTLSSEYLAWYSDGLTLINCHINSTQPLCYCKNLKLINCTFENADRAFEYSDIDAEIKGSVVSIKNPRSGRIVVDEVGEIISGDTAIPCAAEIIVRSKEQLQA